MEEEDGIAVLKGGAHMNRRILAFILCLLTLLTLLPAPVSAEQASLEILSQPADCTVYGGQEAAVTVTASGDGLTYQWYYKNKGSAKYVKSGMQTDTYAIEMTKERDGRVLYCVVKDAYGNSVKSETATIRMTKPKITAQPVSCSVNMGETASVTVGVEGTGLSYQWYYKNKGSTKYVKSGMQTDTYAIEMTKERDGRVLYCVVKDAYGNSVKSETATINVNKPKITAQPADTCVKIGETASVTVSATGEGLTYQWYYKNKGSSKYVKSGMRTDTYAIAMTKERDGRILYCVIKDKNGYTVQSKTATISAEKPKIVTQPASAYAEAGEAISTTVVASGEGLTYQWYYKDRGSSKYVKSSKQTDTYATVMNAGINGRTVYCVVTDKYGFRVTSATATLKIPQYATITKQPKNTKIAIGTTGSCSLGATGDGLTYQWYLADAGSDVFRKSSITKATYPMTMSVEQSGRKVYCVVSDIHGTSVQSNTVTLVALGSFNLSQYSLKTGDSKDMSQELAFTTQDTLVWKSSNPDAVSVTEEGVITRHAKGTVTLTVTGTNTGITASCKIKVPGRKQVALTFDDGPSRHTARFLDYLETTDAKVTFFMVGNRMNSYKNTVKRMAQQGHELGYHSWDHYNQTKRSSSQITSEYKKANDILKKLTGKSFTVWRTPGGAFNKRVLQAVPLPHIFWTSSTADWQTRNEEKVYQSILKLAKDGSIILLHDLHGTTVDGAIRAMKKLEKEGYEFVTVTELLSRDGTPPSPSVSYHKG